MNNYNFKDKVIFKIPGQFEEIELSGEIFGRISKNKYCIKDTIGRYFIVEIENIQLDNKIKE